jgi:sodium/bile acid cotransporter 7
MCTPSEAESSATPQDKDDLPPVTTTEVTSGNEELNNKQEEVKDENDVTPLRRFCRRAIDFYWANDFLILIVLAILLARAYPPLGAIYLAPQITADWIAVVFIFLLSGLDLKTEEFKNAFKQVYFNLFVQVFNFLIVSAVAFGVSRGLAKAGLLSQDLADGMVICSCLPMAISMGTVLTRSSNGDEAAAIFNSAFANLAGVFISPALILGYLGTEGDMDLVNVFYKLALKVLLPILVGQIVQKTSKAAVAYVKKYKKYFGLAQKYCLVFIVYTVFCKTFSKGGQRDIGSVFFMGTLEKRERVRYWLAPLTNTILFVVVQFSSNSYY